MFLETRVPIQHLFDCLASGESLDEFLDQFPTVSREQALRVLEISKEKLLADYACDSMNVSHGVSGAIL